MQYFKFIGVLILIGTKLCYAQEGFRKELPLNELTLDTPFSVLHYDDFQIIEFLFDTIHGELIHSCKIDENGEELFSVETNKVSKSWDRSKMYYYNPDGTLHAIKSFYFNTNEYDICLFYYNEKGQKIKMERFGYRKSRKLKPGISTDTLEYFYSKHHKVIKSGNQIQESYSMGVDSEMEKLYDYNYNWQQEYLCTWQYDNNGRVIKCDSKDELNQKNRTESFYDKNGRTIKVLGYRNFLPYNDKKGVDDTLTSIVKYKYFIKGFVKILTWKDFDINYLWINTMIVNKKNQVVKIIKNQKNTAESNKSIDEVPFSSLAHTIQYDSYGRKTLYTNEDGYKEIYIYKNEKVRDLKHMEF